MAPEDFSRQASRENPDPEEAATPIPNWVLGMALVLVVGCSFYILRTSGASPSAYGDNRTVSDLKRPAPSATGTQSTVDGATVFAARCAACHQATGSGLPGVFPPLAGSNWVNGRETTVVQIVLHGIQGSLTVNGVTYQGTMPTFGALLGDAEIAAVLTYVRGHWGNHASAVLTALVSAQRVTTAQRNAPWVGDSDLSTLP